MSLARCAVAPPASAAARGRAATPAARRLAPGGALPSTDAPALGRGRARPRSGARPRPSRWRARASRRPAAAARGCRRSTWSAWRRPRPPRTCTCSGAATPRVRARHSPRTPSGRDAWQAKLGKVLCPACELLLGCTRGPAHTAGVRAGTLPAAPIAHALSLAHFVPAAVCSHSLLSSSGDRVCTLAIRACRHGMSHAEQTTTGACTPGLLALHRAPESCDRLDSSAAAV